ncbi:epidermal growth factor receptor-like [Gigantopelta aegis]|uniref:epidermal growth factor receptor-like n=1 Tax=Gigantopelta aegis TaxID=1735272 RepID=UPI001B888705|nr:epidermal growth factor receptor-like [Gigantopelta aegis]
MTVWWIWVLLWCFYMRGRQGQKVCIGTDQGFSYTGDLLQHYERLQRRYADCTHVSGNLEITHISDPNIGYNLTFLQTIQYVTGYVLIGLVTEVKIIPLDRLQVIRGDATFNLLGKRCSLAVTLTSTGNDTKRGLREIHLPALTEIIRGNVAFFHNADLCYVDTVLWSAITGDKNDAVFTKTGSSPLCKPCSVSCYYGNVSRCWGPSRNLCQKVEDENTEPTEKDKVCSGTQMGFSYSGSLERHYQRLRHRYTDCTYIRGNLELTHLRDPRVQYDLSFLKTIRYVTGYVLVAMITRVPAIPLDSLQTIRGDELFPLLRSECSLAVALNYDDHDGKRGLRELRLLSLTDISHGEVVFVENPHLCYVNTINWDDVIGGKTKPRFTENHSGIPAFSETCKPCSPSCQNDKTRRCWGHLNKHCQKVADYDNNFIDNECHGTNMGLSYVGSLQKHYDWMKSHYRYCTYVHGNLEITHLRDPAIHYDLSFLEHIRYVTGYVLIALISHVEVVPLTRLEIIRGNTTFDLFNDRSSLAVLVTYSRNEKGYFGLVELQMPALKEISRGRIIFSQNPTLCYVHTIHWDSITGGRYAAVTMDTSDGVTAFSQKCDVCPSVCEVEGVKRCWGQSTRLCQRVLPSKKCHTSCPQRCFALGLLGCCRSQCASTCDGPTTNDCKLCKDYRFGHQCLSSCPYDRHTFPVGQICAVVPP